MSVKGETALGSYTKKSRQRSVSFSSHLFGRISRPVAAIERSRQMRISAVPICPLDPITNKLLIILLLKFGGKRYRFQQATPILQRLVQEVSKSTGIAPRLVFETRTPFRKRPMA